MQKIIVGLTVCWLAWLTPITSTAAPITHVSTNTTSHHGSLYRVRHQHNTAWLFGTIHLGTAEIDPLAGEVKTALATADKVVLEFDINDTPAIRAAVNRYAMYPVGDTLNAHLPASAVSQLRDALNHAHIPFAAIEAMKPWFVANLLMMAELEHHRYSPKYATEVALATFATAHRIPIISLESADFQLALFDQMSEADQVQYLQETLTEISNGTTVEKTKELFKAWADADDTALNAFLQELDNDDSLSAHFMKSDFLDKRNPAMADGIERLMKTNATIFVGVGLLHLLGAQGLPETLRRRGYDVQKIY